jgi:hypothetical protein
MRITRCLPRDECRPTAILVPRVSNSSSNASRGLIQIRHSLGGNSPAHRAAATHTRFANIAHVELCEEMSRRPLPYRRYRPQVPGRHPGAGTSSLERTPH